MRALSGEIIQKISGLFPSAVLCVGRGFSREEWKALCFQQDKSLIQDAIQNPRQIAEHFVPESRGRVLESFSRVELLRQAFKAGSLEAAVPHLSAQRLRSRFFENLDRALQQGRLLFAHLDEAAVYEARLKEKLGDDARREEMFLLNRYWERLLEVRDVWDEARVFGEATKRLQEGASVPNSLKSDRDYFKLELYPDSPRVQLFWDEFAKHFSLRKIRPEDFLKENDLPFAEMKVHRSEAHSLEDAAHFLLDSILAESKSDSAEKTWNAISTHHIAIPDVPSIRRTLKRVADSRGVPLLDPRDPTFGIQSEEIKTALLEFELVAKNFPADLALSWISASSKNGEHRKKIIEQGITNGLKSYQFLPEVYPAFQKLNQQYPSRSSLPNLKESLFQSFTRLKLEPWVAQFFERMFGDWTESLKLIDLENKKRPLRYWLEQVDERVRKLPPVLSPLRFQNGLSIQRADQSPSAALLSGAHESENTRIHFFGISPSFFEIKERGSEWLSARELDVLSSEFGIPSFRDQERVIQQTFLNWVRCAPEHCTEWTYEYDESGMECENTDLNHEEIKVEEKEMLGMHPVHEGSMVSHFRAHDEMVALPLKDNRYPVSFLNAYGSCPFTAYAQHLLKLYDERDTDFELAGDTYGNLVHNALETLLRDSVSSDDAFESAWKTTKLQGLLKSDRLFKSMRRSVIKLLDTFLASEMEYQARSEAKPIEFEKEIEWQSEGITFSGRIDRIDQHHDGLILIDYKTGQSVPSAEVTQEKGIGLQLPLYSLAVEKLGNQPVIGAQYIRLKEDETNRNAGFMFQKWNKGKKADEVDYPISTLRAKHKSLVLEMPDEVWPKVEAQINRLITQMKSGKFAPTPSEPKDCERCRYALTCGRRRTLSGQASDSNLNASDSTAEN
jgi:RecB family exonuclease